MMTCFVKDCGQPIVDNIVGGGDGSTYAFCNKHIDAALNVLGLYERETCNMKIQLREDLRELREE